MLMNRQDRQDRQDKIRAVAKASSRQTFILFYLRYSQNKRIATGMTRETLSHHGFLETEFLGVKHYSHSSRLREEASGIYTWQAIKRWRRGRREDVSGIFSPYFSRRRDHDNFPSALTRKQMSFSSASSPRKRNPRTHRCHMLEREGEPVSLLFK